MLARTSTAVFNRREESGHLALFLILGRKCLLPLNVALMITASTEILVSKYHSPRKGIKVTWRSGWSQSWDGENKRNFMVLESKKKKKKMKIDRNEHLRGHRSQPYIIPDHESCNNFSNKISKDNIVLWPKE